MKYLALLVVLWIGFWLWRQERRARLSEKPSPAAAAKARPQPQQMLRCAHCGIHLPAAEALRDANGRVYCCTSHRQADSS